MFVLFHFPSNTFPPNVVTVSPTEKGGGGVLSIITLLLSVVLLTVAPSIPPSSDVKSIENVSGPSSSVSLTICVDVYVLLPWGVTTVSLPFT